MAFALTLLAGLSTGIGSLLALLRKRTNTRSLSIALGFSAGVMIYVSMIEVFASAQDSLISSLGQVTGSWVTVLSFFGGMLLIAIIDNYVPNVENPHELRLVEELDKEQDADFIKQQSLFRMGIMTALVIMIHNFPEGIATFASTLKDPRLGISIAIAVAIHNIPEGIAISIPLFYATGSRRTAFRYSFLSGLTEPLGALVGYLILAPFLNDVLFGVLFAGVAGIMVFISLDELLPAAREYGEPHLSIYGVISGMFVMAVSLLLII